MLRRMFLLCSAFVMASCARRHPRLLHLHILREDVRFDDEQELDLVQLRSRIRDLKREDPRPDISVEPSKDAKYDTVAKVFSLFQEEDYGPHFGFIGLDKPG